MREKPFNRSACFLQWPNDGSKKRPMDAMECDLVPGITDGRTGGCTTTLSTPHRFRIQVAVYAELAMKVEYVFTHDMSTSRRSRPRFTPATGPGNRGTVDNTAEPTRATVRTTR